MRFTVLLQADTSGWMSSESFPFSSSVHLAKSSWKALVETGQSWLGNPSPSNWNKEVNLLLFYVWPKWLHLMDPYWHKGDFSSLWCPCGELLWDKEFNQTFSAYLCFCLFGVASRNCLLSSSEPPRGRSIPGQTMFHKFKSYARVTASSNTILEPQTAGQLSLL